MLVLPLKLSSVHLNIGCQLELFCESATPVLTLVHPHPTLLEDLLGPEVVHLTPDRGFEVLTDSGGNRWSRWLAPAGLTRFRFTTTLARPDSVDLVVPTAPPCPVEHLPIDTYRHLNASTYCDTAPLMSLAWDTFGSTHVQGWAVRVPCWGLPRLMKRRVRRCPPSRWIQVRAITPPIEKPSRSRGVWPG